MDNKLIIPLVCLTLAGLFFLGSGITGMIISESCCMGTGCNPENLCDAAKPNLEAPTGTQGINTYIGLGLILASTGLFIVLNRSP